MRYELRDELPTAQQFQAVRDAAGMSERSREGVERGLPKSVYGVSVRTSRSTRPRTRT